MPRVHSLDDLGELNHSLHRAKALLIEAEAERA